MKNKLHIVLLIIALIIVAAIAISIKTRKLIDWEESFNEKSNKPYGVSVFYNELENIFKGKKIRTVYHQPFSYLRANTKNGGGDHIAKGNYLIIGHSDNLNDESVDELLNFVTVGNTLFISDYSFPYKIHDTLGINVDYILNKKDSISHLSLKNRNIENIIIDRNKGDSYFSSFNTKTHETLGYSKIDYKHINFIKIPFGKGYIYLHLEPKSFTNYNILKDDRYKYIEAVISYLPEEDVYFDSYSKIQTNYNREVEKKSNLSWFLEQEPFKWAWYTTVIFGILFMIFNAKRRQRIIKIIKPLQNTTMDFVKTISNLYFETKDHKNLIEKKTTYFLERLRTDYNINTINLDEAFIKKLASKTLIPKEDVKKLINYINWLKTKNEFFEEDLIKLNKLIEEFYSK